MLLKLIEDTESFNIPMYGSFEINKFESFDFWRVEGHSDAKVLSKWERQIKLINCFASPALFLCLIFSDFDMTNWHLFWPEEEECDYYMERYGDRIFGVGKG